MRASILLAATLSLAAGAAAAQSLADNPPKATIICLDVAGKSLPATCQVSGSRRRSSDDPGLWQGRQGPRREPHL
jgi:hypothetical protein